MLAALKSKLVALPFGHAAPLDGGAALAVALRPSDTPASTPARAATTSSSSVAAPASPCTSATGAAGAKPGPAARAASRATAAADAAKAAAAVQLERLDAWRHALMLRIGSAALHSHAAAGASISGAGGCRGAAAVSPTAALGEAFGGGAADRRARGSGGSIGGSSGHRVSGSGASGWPLFRASACCAGDDPLLAGALHAAAPAAVPAAAATQSCSTTNRRLPLHPSSFSAATAPVPPATCDGAATGARAATSGGRPSSFPSSGRSPSSATHLIVMANGLFGSPSNWSVICERLREHLDVSAVLLHPSRVNRLTDTYDGIDVCGQRLADEIRSVAAAHPSLQRISVIGHSMGGLLLRYALGALYNPSTGRVAGLRPAHFISLATPHMGCDAEGLAQVPFIGWVPVKPVQRVLQVLSVPTATVFFRRTGRQFFLADGSTTAAVASSSSSSNRAGGNLGIRSNSNSNNLARRGTGGAAAIGGGNSRGLQMSASSPASAAGTALPLLYRMTQDEPERGLYFYSALASFASRTAYANTDGDHLVGWANSSLRFLHQLPQLPPEAARARGVVLQDPLLSAFDVRSKPDLEPQSATSPTDLPIDLPAQPQSLSSPQPPAVPLAAAAPSRQAEAAPAAPDLANDPPLLLLPPSAAASAAADPAATAAMAEVMLRRLQRLPWRRIDVSFRAAVFGFAHNNIQVTRRWLNFEGMAVTQHLARQLAALEAEVARREEQGQAATEAQRRERKRAAAAAASATTQPESLQAQDVVSQQQPKREEQREGGDEGEQGQQQQGPSSGEQTRVVDRLVVLAGDVGARAGLAPLAAAAFPPSGIGAGCQGGSGGSAAAGRVRELLLSEAEVAAFVRELREEEGVEGVVAGDGLRDEEVAAAADEASVAMAAASAPTEGGPQMGVSQGPAGS